MSQFLSVYNKNLNTTKRYSSKDLTTRHVQDKFIKICPDIIIKTSIEPILVTLLTTLKMFLSVEKKFWKAPSRIISQNLGIFQCKYLWWSSVLAKAFSLPFTVILLTILQLMVLRNVSEAHSEPNQTSKMEHFAKIVNG